MAQSACAVCDFAGECKGPQACRYAVLFDRDTDNPPVCELFGHYLYVRGCKAKLDSGDIEIPNGFEDASYFFEVVAVGPKVGKRRSGKSKDLKARGHLRHQNSPMRVGDFVLLPYDTAWGTMWLVPGMPMTDRIVDESQILAWISKEDFAPWLR